ncbi:hypothetical protein NKH18_28090 [Streptomyces sp. M10(2022)]
MTWAEWEQLKAEAAERAPSQMQLNQLQASGGVGGGQKTWSSTTTHWEARQPCVHATGGPAGGRRPCTPDHLRRLHRALQRRPGHGFRPHRAARAWNTQVGTLKEACAHISNHLDYSRALHAKDEVRIATEMRNESEQPMSESRIQNYWK